MYAPCFLSSRARVGSTGVTYFVTFLALSLGISLPQKAHVISSFLPDEPLALPLLLRFLGMVFPSEGSV